MKEFRIGQRVRIIKACAVPSLIGCVGTITSRLYQSCGQMVQDVDLDGMAKVVDHGGARFGVRFHLANKDGKEIRGLGEANVFPTDELKIGELDKALFVYCT